MTRKSKPSFKKFPPVLYWALTGAAFLGTMSCSNVSSDNLDVRQGQRGPVPLVEVVKPRAGEIPLQERLTGGVRAHNQTDIFPEIGGRIVEVRARDGDQVRRGDVLVRLRDSEFQDRLRQAQHDFEVVQAQLRQAEATLSRLHAQHRRTEELVKLKLEAEIQLETLEADIRQAEAGIDLARAQLRRAEAQIQEHKSALENTVVTAPIDGVVGNRNAEIGMRVDSGTRLFEIGDTSRMLVTLTITEHLANRIQPGDRVEIRSPQLTEPIVSSIRRLSPFLDPVTHSASAEIMIENAGQRLRPGMFVTVDVSYGESERGQIIPRAALYENPSSGEVGVYIAALEAPAAPAGFQGNPGIEGTADEVGPVAVEFVAVETVTEGRETVMVRGLDDWESWVVVNGQNQISEWDSPVAHARRTDWDRVLRLQSLQDRDLLNNLFGESDEPPLDNEPTFRE